MSVVFVFVQQVYPLPHEETNVHCSHVKGREGEKRFTASTDHSAAVDKFPSLSVWLLTCR